MQFRKMDVLKHLMHENMHISGKDNLYQPSALSLSGRGTSFVPRWNEWLWLVKVTMLFR